MNGPGTFIQIISNLFPNNLGQLVGPHIADVLIYSDTEQEHLKHIAMVGDKLKEPQFYPSRKKSERFTTSMDVLGHIIDDQVFRVLPEKIARIEVWTTPKNKKQLQEFLGVVNYMSPFIPHLASTTVPLTSLREQRSLFGRQHMITPGIILSELQHTTRSWNWSTMN